MLAWEGDEIHTLGIECLRGELGHRQGNTAAVTNVIGANLVKIVIFLRRQPATEQMRL